MSRTWYTLADIERLTGAKRRAVQLWADAGALKALPQSDRAGSGTHRQFPQKELEIAAILTPLARMGIPIGQLCRGSTVIRKLPLWSKRQDKEAKRMLRVLERARRSEGRNYLVFVGVGGDRLKVDFVTGDRNSVLVQTDPQAESAILVNLNEALRRLHQ